LSAYKRELFNPSIALLKNNVISHQEIADILSLSLEAIESLAKDLEKF
jgi:biotin operon repressor